MKVHILISLFTVITFSSFAQTNWKLTNYKVGFKIKHVMGATADGKFEGLTINFKFDPNQLASSSLSASIKANTLDTDNGMRDKHVTGEEYLNAEKYPLIKVVSTKLVSKGGNSFEGEFNVTIRSVTKKMVIPFTFEEINPKAVFKAKFDINRLDFGVGESSFMLDDIAHFRVEIETIKN